MALLTRIVAVALTLLVMGETITIVQDYQQTLEL